jgi:acyl carrier protein
METTAIYDKMTAILREVFDDDNLVAREDLTAKQVEGWDSLAHIRLVLSVEKAFKIKFSAAEIGKLKNVGEFVGLIKGKL